MSLDISYANKKLKAQCTEAKVMARAFDSRICKGIRNRMVELKSANTIQDLLDGTGKWHWLTEDDVLAASVTRNWRMIVRPAEKENNCSVVEIERIEDYH